MALKNSRVARTGSLVTGVVMDEQPDENDSVLVHWGVADGKPHRTVEPMAGLTPVETSEAQRLLDAEVGGWVG